MTTDDTLGAARESFSGKSMTETQLKEAMAIADIIHGEIQRSGSFIEKLTDYTHAFARNERFDAMRSETMIRDVFTATKGQSMNQMREELMARQEALTHTDRTVALVRGDEVGLLIKEGPTRPFYQAYDMASSALADDLGITQNAAKTLMKDAYRTAHNRSLYEDGKAAEETHHRPVREAEMTARKAEQTQSRSQSQSYG